MNQVSQSDATGGRDWAGLYVVDVCGTLVYDDTTVSLLRYHFAHAKGRQWRRFVLGLATSRRSPIALFLALIERLSGKHVTKRICVRMLAGDSMEAVRASARSLADILLRERSIPATNAIIARPLTEGRVILASASLQPIVEALAAKLGARFVASMLEERHGMLTGRFAVDLTGKKGPAVLAKFGSEALSGEVCVITDNATDLPLVTAAARAFVVLRRSRHRRRWRGVRASFIELG